MGIQVGRAMKEKEANLGHATTRELLLELSSRGRTSEDEMGEYLEAAADEILAGLDSEMLNYRTVDEK